MICPNCRRETPSNKPFCEHCSQVLPALPVELPQSGSFAWTRFAIIGGAGCLALLCLLCAGLIVVTEVPDLIGLTLSAALATIPAVGYVAVVLLVDRYEHEPLRLILLAFFWGAVVAIVFAFALNTAVDVFAGLIIDPAAASTLTAFLAAPPIEEGFKGLFLLLLVAFFREEFDNPLDGIVYGSIVGLGFAMTENIVYFGRQYAEGGLVDLAFIVVLRAVLGGTGHALFTATMGAAIGYARESDSWAIKLGAPVLGYLLAVAQHSAWNLFAGTVVPGMLPQETSTWVYFLLIAPIQTLILTGPGTLTLIWIILVTWQREASIIREQLEPEVETGLISESDYDILSSSRRRLKSLWMTLTQQGLMAFLHRRQYIQTLTELAFQKWHVSRGERPKRSQRRIAEEQYRERIRRLQAQLALNQ